MTEDMPPCFLWQTATDELVPVQNSFLFAQALQEKKIPYAFHVFSKGKHGQMKSLENHIHWNRLLHWGRQ